MNQMGATCGLPSARTVEFSGSGAFAQEVIKFVAAHLVCHVREHPKVLVTTDADMRARSARTRGPTVRSDLGAPGDDNQLSLTRT